MWIKRRTFQSGGLVFQRRRLRRPVPPIGNQAVNGVYKNSKRYNDGVVALPRGGVRPQRRRVTPDLCEATVSTTSLSRKRAIPPIQADHIVELNLACSTA